MVVRDGRPLPHLLRRSLMQLSTWAAALAQDARILVVVNSADTRFDEIIATIDAIEQHAPLGSAAAIVPAALRSWFVRRGFPAGRVVDTRLHGVDVDLAYFLDSPFAIMWSLQQQCDVVIATQPNLPSNAEVKATFEERAAAIVGGGRFLVHTLPHDQLIVLTAGDLTARASREIAVHAHRGRQQRALAEAHRRWVDLGRPRSPAYASEAAGAIAARMPPASPSAEQHAAALQLALATSARLRDALSDVASSTRGVPPVQVAPPGASPAAGWIPSHVEAIWESHYVAGGVRWEGPRLVMRADAEGPYSYLFISAEEDLRRGDAAVATGRVFRGGVTIGLQRNGEWVSRVDLDQPGPFVVMVVAQEAGDYQLGIANCLRGAESRTAFAIRRFGWTRRER